MYFFYVDFWVQVHDLPSRFASKMLAKSIRNIMGQLIEYDAIRGGLCCPIICTFRFNDNDCRKLLELSEGEVVWDSAIEELTTTEVDEMMKHPYCDSAPVRVL
ncbi:hypothetical protein Goshw_024518, partial [Gossypium schwendimanii]|nr:hypothetical protein [Gossypium schwendimanii]